MVWSDDNAVVPYIRGRRVTVPASGDPTTFGSKFQISVQQTSPSEDDYPRISKCAGANGELLVAWTRLFFVLPSVVCRVIDRDGTLLSFETPVTSMPELAFHPDVDGDGNQFVVTYGDNGSHVLARTVTAGLVPQVGAAVMVDSGVHPASGAAVSWTGDEFVIAWEDAYALTDHDIFVKGIDPFTCATCEPQQIAIFSSLDQTQPCIASQWSGDHSGEGALVGWETDDVEANLWQNSDGTVTDLGGGCGGGGVAHATCAKVGNTGFTHRLTGAAVLKPAWLLLGFKQTSVVCGTCKLVVDPNVAAFLIAAGSTGIDGTQAFALPIPNDAGLAGLTVFDQWIVDTAPANCSGVDFSNGVAVKIE